MKDSRIVTTTKNRNPLVIIVTILAIIAVVILLVLFINKDNNLLNNKAEETQEVEQAIGRLEILDEKMGVFDKTADDREGIDTVYEGRSYEFYEVYDDGKYDWYRIGANRWIKDSDGTRVKTHYY